MSHLSIPYGHLLRVVGGLGLVGNLIACSDSEPNASIRSDAGSVDGGMVDSGTPSAPEPIASTQTVSLLVTNTSSQTRFLATEGQICDVVHILDDGQPVIQGFANNITCEGFPLPSGVTLWRALRPAETTTLTWDARALVTVTREIDCAERGVPGLKADEVRGALQPVSPGDYTASVKYLNAPPLSCVPDDQGVEWQCSRMFGPAPSGRFAEQCAEGQMISTTFKLLAAGDISATINLP